MSDWSVILIVIGFVAFACGAIGGAFAGMVAWLADVVDRRRERRRIEREPVPTTPRWQETYTMSPPSFVTNTPRPGEAPEQIASRDHAARRGA